MRPLSNGGGISMTIAKWYTPNGNIIHELGVNPDVLIPSQDPSDTTGVQTEGVKEYIRTTILN
jgi:Periplasmic protease